MLPKILMFSPPSPQLPIHQCQEFGQKGKLNENSCFREVLVQTALLKKGKIIPILQIFKLQVLPFLKRLEDTQHISHETSFSFTDTDDSVAYLILHLDRSAG